MKRYHLKGETCEGTFVYSVYTPSMHKHIEIILRMYCYRSKQAAAAITATMVEEKSLTWFLHSKFTYRYAYSSLVYTALIILIFVPRLSPPARVSCCTYGARHGTPSNTKTESNFRVLACHWERIACCLFMKCRTEEGIGERWEGGGEVFIFVTY